MVEKPEPEVAPSNLAIIGRYILTPWYFDIIRDTKPGKGGKFKLQMHYLLKQKRNGFSLQIWRRKIWLWKYWWICKSYKLFLEKRQKKEAETKKNWNKIKWKTTYITTSITKWWANFAEIKRETIIYYSFTLCGYNFI